MIPLHTQKGKRPANVSSKTIKTPNRTPKKAKTEILAVIDDQKCSISFENSASLEAMGLILEELSGNMRKLLSVDESSQALRAREDGRFNFKINKQLNLISEKISSRFGMGLDSLPLTLYR